MLNLKDESANKKKNDVKVSGTTDASKPSEINTVEGDNKEIVKEATKAKEVRLFHDETFKGFFRRLSWSNDGKNLIHN